MFRSFARSGLSLIILICAALLPVAASAQVLNVTPTSVSADTFTGQNAPSQTVSVRNTGGRSMKWSVVAPSASWLSVSPTKGTNTGALVLTFRTSSLPAGSYQTSFRVDSGGGTATVSVAVKIVAAATPKLVVSCPSNASVASPDGSPVAATYSVAMSGGVSPVSANGTPASGSAFPVGTTSVSVTASSSDGQTASCGFGVTVTYAAPPPPPPPPPSTSAVGPQSTITCPAGAIDIWPGTNIQSLVNLYSGNTTFCFWPGVYALTSSITPKTGNTFVGQYGAILDGTGWATTDDTQAAFRAHNQDIDYVTIRNLVIRNMPQRGIHSFYYMSDHWTVEYNEIASNRNVGIVFPGYTNIRNNYIHHNTFSGYMGSRSDYSTLENNEIAYNGSEQKVSESVNVTFRNNFVHHNVYAGIWYDSDNTGSLVEGNRVEDNGASGIWYEISTDGIIRNNTIRRNGDAGVFISTSKNTQIYNNTLENNFRGITYFVNCPSIGGGAIGFDLANNSAHDNTITVGTQSWALAAVFNYSSCTTTQAAPYLNGLKNLTFSNNTYHVPSPTTGQYRYWYSSKYWNGWQVLPQDVTGTMTQ